MRQNSTMKPYLKVFVNFKRDDQAKLLLISEFIYNNANNPSTCHKFFESKYDYHFQMFKKKAFNSCL